MVYYILNSICTTEILSVVFYLNSDLHIKLPHLLPLIFIFYFFYVLLFEALLTVGTQNQENNFAVA